MVEKLSLPGMVERLCNSEQMLNIRLDFLNKTVIVLPEEKTVGSFNMLKSGKAWIEPAALVAIRFACENLPDKLAFAASDKVVRDALTLVYYELAEAWGKANPLAGRAVTWQDMFKEVK